MSEFPETYEMSEEDKKRLKKRNRALGLSLFVFVILIGVVSYYKVMVATP